MSLIIIIIIIIIIMLSGCLPCLIITLLACVDLHGVPCGILSVVLHCAVRSSFYEASVTHRVLD